MVLATLISLVHVIMQCVYGSIQTRWSAYGLSTDDVSDALEDQNIEVSPGKLGESGGQRPQVKEYVLKYPGRYTTEDEYKKYHHQEQ